MDDSFLTIKQSGQAVFKDRNSRFIGHVFPVVSETQVKDIQAQLRKEYYDARHHCFAYIIGYQKEIFRSSDDGEPSGSAGKPIHNQLLSAGVTNVLAVVVRYFGGTKLGVPGLINAYKTATRMALDEALIVEKHTAHTLNLAFTYPEINSVMQIIQTDGVKIMNQVFDNQCSMNLLVRDSMIHIIVSKLSNAGISCNISGDPSDYE